MKWLHQYCPKCCLGDSKASWKVSGLNLHSFAPWTFIRCVLCARHCSRQWEYRHKWKVTSSSHRTHGWEADLLSVVTQQCNKWRSELWTGTVGAEEGKPEGWKMVRISFLERVTPEMNYKEWAGLSLGRGKGPSRQRCLQEKNLRWANGWCELEILSSSGTFQGRPHAQEADLMEISQARPYPTTWGSTGRF